MTQVAANTFGNALGQSIVEASWGDTAWDRMTAEEKFRRLEIEAMNEEARIANVLATSRPAMSEEDYWNAPAKTIANQYADTYGGQTIHVSDRVAPVGSQSVNFPRALPHLGPSARRLSLLSRRFVDPLKRPGHLILDENRIEQFTHGVLFMLRHA